ncbi:MULTISPECIES: AsmA family protein [unclassified Pseudodesulfovibrio]|uniref:AsmA family protein n=1 Tax=unclassified Pseudodesulfovibrio TaxID=2661612 RepID=UPI000FEBF074|nr:MULTISPECIES: AsmA family protein [unclassified Pseudodesulfovibrio]MCJ2164288.1 AsmA family protein [Pseudodesulfovibrio sp. S3-i]RWU04499.1 AsmA family protein [Pseudodesulfovibrio sp. S3]
MSKIIKISLISAAAIVLLFVVAAIALVVLVDPNEYKAEISQAVKEQTGRDLKFEGDIGFNFFPWLGLDVGPMALGNAPGFAPDEMVRINKAEASIRIMPLFSGNLSVGTVVLDGLTLNLAKNAKGVTNWDDLTKAAATDTKDAVEPTEKKSGDTAKKPSEMLSVQGIEITNANVMFDDRQAGTKTSINNLNLIVGEVGNGVRFPFELRFDLKLDNPNIETRPTLTGFAKLDQDTGSMEIDQFTFSALNLEITGLFFAKAKDGTASYSGELKLAEASVRKLMQEIGMEVPATADPKALEALSADLKFNGTESNVSLEKMTVKLDDTTVTVDGSVKNFNKPAMNLNVNVDTMDVDRYLPPKSDTPGDTTQAGPTAATNDKPAEEPDLSGLKGLDLAAKLTVGKLKVMNLTITDILCQLTAKNGVLKAQPVSLNLYDGSYSAEGWLDANPKVATWGEKGGLKGVLAGPLLKDLVGKDHLHGTTSAKYDLKGFGLTPDNIKKSVTGTASFAFTDGAVMGVNVAKMIRDGWNQLKGKAVSADEPAKTDFAELLGSATITNGLIDNQDLLMKSPLLRVTGKGWANLPRNNTDYTATVTVVGTLEGQDGASMEDLKGLPLPINVKGDLNDPKISLDLKAMGEALFKGTFKQGAKRLEEKLKKDLLGGSQNSGSTGSTTDTKTNNPLGGLLKKK